MHNTTNETGTIGSRLRDARKKQKLSQSAVAKALGIPKYQTISAYETDKHNPSFKTLKQLCEIYHVSADFILFGTNKATYKSNKDYLIQLIEAADHFRFDFWTEELLYPNQSCGVELINAPHRISLLPNKLPSGESIEANYDISSYKRFLSDWYNLRVILREGTISQAQYDTIISEKLNSLDNVLFKAITQSCEGCDDDMANPF